MRPKLYTGTRRRGPKYIRNLLVERSILFFVPQCEQTAVPRAPSPKDTSAMLMAPARTEGELCRVHSRLPGATSKLIGAEHLTPSTGARLQSKQLNRKIEEEKKNVCLPVSSSVSFDTLRSQCWLHHAKRYNVGRRVYFDAIGWLTRLEKPKYTTKKERKRA